MPPTSAGPMPALVQPSFFRQYWILLLLPAVAAILLVGHSLFHATAVEEVLLVGLALTVLVAGHALMRSRASRVAAERESDRIRADLELRARVGECEQRGRSLSAFARMAAHVAHEVRNPLNSILLNAELLEEEAARCNCDNSGESRALIVSIKKEAERLQHLTDEYLAFSRPPRPSPGHGHLNAIVDDLVVLVREQAARQGVTLVADLSRARPCAVMDSDQIKQAALNLVRNALEAMPHGGRLTLGTQIERDGTVALSVADTGPGIADELRDQLFDPFFTTKVNGTGLGLSLSAQIVREHKGFIDARNGDGGGARFTIQLPPTRAESGASSSESPAPAAAAEGTVTA